MDCALRRFSVSSGRTRTNSGAVLWCQSMNPTYDFSLEHLTQVFVCGTAAIRAAGITVSQSSHNRIISETPSIVLRNSTTLNPGIGCTARGSICMGLFVVSPWFRYCLGVFANRICFAFCCNIYRIYVSLHGFIIPYSYEPVKPKTSFISSATEVSNTPSL